MRGQAKCSVEDLLQPRALSRDPLECPVCSYEWASAVAATVVVSKVLNAAFSFPGTNEYIMCSWDVVLRRAWQSRPAGDYLHPLRVARSVVRFNLRFLAGYRVLAVLFGSVLFLLFKNALVGLPVFLVGLLSLAYVFYENNFSSAW